VYDNLIGIDSGWVGLQSLIKVVRESKTKAIETKEVAYFISSLPSTTPAKTFNEGIRSHWAIESALHYSKDVTFKEDASKIRTKNAPQNISIIINMIINIFKKNGYTNMAQAIRIVSNDIPMMYKLLLA
jgi:predicted transposase YbfD/YdcC